MSDNVIRPVFGKKRPEAVAVPTTQPEPLGDAVSDDYEHIEPPTGEALVRAQKDLMYMIANSDFVHEMREKLKQAGDAIFSLRDYVPDKENIRLRRQGLTSCSLEDICEKVGRTHDLQWQKQPSYVGALTLEYHHRVQVALSIMPEE